MPLLPAPADVRGPDDDDGFELYLRVEDLRERAGRLARGARSQRAAAKAVRARAGLLALEHSVAYGPEDYSFVIRPGPRLLR